MKLQTKIVLNSFLSIVFAIVIMIFIIVRMMDMQSASNDFSNNLLKIEQFNSSLVGFQQSLDNFGKNPSEGNLFNAVTNYNIVLDKANFLSSIPMNNEKEVKRVELILTKIKNMEADMNAVINDKVTVEAMQLSSKLYGIMNDIYLLNRSMNEQYTQLTRENNNQILYISIVSALLLLVVSSIFNLIISRSIVKPISILNEYSKEIAAGNLALEEVQFNSKDEVGELTRSFNTMKTDLQINIDKIQRHANELLEKNTRINDSIDYAKRIQEAVLPTEQEIANSVKDHFLIWKPRDTVGGDFYWCKKTEKGMFLAVADCTGHGVPGALMTTLSISALNHIVEEEKNSSPALILEKLNRLVKQSLNQETKTGFTDDGLDIGICYIEQDTLTFAGAKLSLYRSRYGEVLEMKGDRKSIGYRRTPIDYRYNEQKLQIEKNDVFYITTDGFVDQNGTGEQYSLGKSFFIELIRKWSSTPLIEQKAVFEEELKLYMGKETQRDDITILAFKL